MMYGYVAPVFWMFIEGKSFILMFFINKFFVANDSLFCSCDSIQKSGLLFFAVGVYLHSRVVTNVFENAEAPFKFYYFVGWGESGYKS